MASKRRRYGKRAASYFRRKILTPKEKQALSRIRSNEDRAALEALLKKARREQWAVEIDLTKLEWIDTSLPVADLLKMDQVESVKQICHIFGVPYELYEAHTKNI